VANALDDRRSLENWIKRTVAVGLIERPDLLMRLAAEQPTINSKHIDPLIKQAVDAAKSDERANLGTALHRFCERVDRGEEVTAPEPYAADVIAYQEATRGFKWMVVEEVVVLEDLGIAGMPDRIGYAPDGTLLVADIKTGKGSPPEGKLIYGWLAFTIQGALYAHADNIYDIADDQRLPMPRELDKATGVIIHLPAGEGRCELWDMDLKKGWEYAELALEVMQARSTQRSLASPRVAEALRASLASVPVPDSPEAPDVPQEAPQVPVGSRLLASEALGARASGLEPDETQMADTESLELLKARYEGLPVEDRAWVTAVVKSATLNNVSPSRLHVKTLPSLKRFELLRALTALCLGGYADDHALRDLLLAIDPVLAMPAISLGAALSVLTTEEATTLAQMVDLFANFPLLKGTGDNE